MSQGEIAEAEAQVKEILKGAKKRLEEVTELITKRSLEQLSIGEDVQILLQRLKVFPPKRSFSKGQFNRKKHPSRSTKECTSSPKSPCRN